MAKPVEHNAVSLTPKQRKSLSTLATILYDHVKDRDRRHRHFAMQSFILDANMNTIEREGEKLKKGSLTACNTAACAAGWGAMFHELIRQPVPVDLSGGIDWEEFVRSLVGEDMDVVGSNDLTTFLFGGGWSQIDNTSNGAARRIWYVLKFGIPVTSEYTWDTFGWMQWAKKVYYRSTVKSLREGLPVYSLNKLPKHFIHDKGIKEPNNAGHEDSVC